MSHKIPTPRPEGMVKPPPPAPPPPKCCGTHSLTMGQPEVEAIRRTVYMLRLIELPGLAEAVLCAFHLREVE